MCRKEKKRKIHIFSYLLPSSQSKNESNKSKHSIVSFFCLFFFAGWLLQRRNDTPSAIVKFIHIFMGIYVLFYVLGTKEKNYEACLVVDFLFTTLLEVYPMKFISSAQNAQTTVASVIFCRFCVFWSESEIYFKFSNLNPN
jgi:predicted MFS family arabinose efflux permease